MLVLILAFKKMIGKLKRYRRDGECYVSICGDDNLSLAVTVNAMYVRTYLPVVTASCHLL